VRFESMEDIVNENRKVFGKFLIFAQIQKEKKRRSWQKTKKMVKPKNN
jgi:hypothetical protein